MAMSKQNGASDQKSRTKAAPRDQVKKKQQGSRRSKPGSQGEGEYYHVVLRSKNQFEKFRTQDVGREGHTLRVAGKRSNGTWDTQKWLISKSDAIVENGYLHGRIRKVKKILAELGSIPRRKEGDIFYASPGEE